MWSIYLPTTRLCCFWIIFASNSSQIVHLQQPHCYINCYHIKKLTSYTYWNIFNCFESNVIKSCILSAKISLDTWPIRVLTFIWLNSYVFWLFTTRCFAWCCDATVCCLSSICPPVCPSVTFRYRDHIGWNTSNITSRLISLRFMLGLTQTWVILSNGNTPKLGRIFCVCVK